jgi:hypothetical protein
MLINFPRIHVMLLASAALAACSTAESTRDVRGDGAYRYIFGVDETTGEPIVGGVHLVVDLGDSRGKAEAIDDANRASRLHPDLSTLAYLKYDASIVGGETDWEVFASYWWPQSKNGTAFRWQPGSNQDYNDLTDRDRLSPMEKYDLLFYPNQSKSVAAVEHCEYRDFVKNGADACTKIKRPAVTVAGPATKWELENQGTYQKYDPESWWGHCNGWASYATAEPDGFPKRDVRVKFEGGKVIECASASEPGCVLFKMADVEALMTELYFSDKATFTGRRCEEAPDDMERDEYGRPTNPACRDMNAGTVHIALSGLLGKGARNLVTNEPNKRPAFVIDHNYDFEIWNFPLVKFQIRSAKEITLEEANRHIGANGSTYKFNPAARKFIEVRATYWMVSDAVPANQLHLRADQRNMPLHPVDLNYVLELDSSDKILGGEWIKDPQTSWGEDSKKLHPDFLWMALDPQGHGEQADDLGGNSDNPFVAYSKVKAILKCANDASTCAASGGGGGGGGTTSVCQGKCGQGPFTENGASCYCDDQCAKYGDCCGGYAEVCEMQPPPPPPTSSCEGLCGSTTAVPGSSPACYCDASCATYGDCCGDKVAVCGS